MKRRNYREITIVNKYRMMNKYRVEKMISVSKINIDETRTGETQSGNPDTPEF